MNEDGIPEDLADAVEAAFVSVITQARASAVAAIRARSSTLVAAAGTDHVAQPDAVFNVDEWMERVNAEVGPTIEKVLIDSANQAGIGVSLDLADPRMAAAAVRHVEGIASWGQNFRQTVAKVIEEGMAKGWSVDRMADKLAETGSLTDASARRIARTEAIAAANAGTIEGWKLLGFVTGKRWLATPDEKTRDTHAAADGQEVPIDGRFTIGDGTADYPGDPALPVGERVNCRCRMLSIDDGADAAKPEPQDTTVTMPAKSSIRLPQPPPGTPTVDDGGWRTTADRAVHARSLWAESPTVRRKIVDVQANLVKGRAADHAVDFVDVVMELASDPTITIDSISQRWWQQPEVIRDHVVAAADELLGQLDDAPAVNRRLYAPVDPRWLAGALLVGATIAMLSPSEWTDTDDGEGVVAMDPPVDAVEVVPGSYLWAGAVQVTGIDRDRSRLSVRPLDRSRTLVATAAKADVYARPVDTDDDRTLIGRVEFANPNHDERGRFARKDEGRRVPTKGVDGHSGGGIPDKVSLKAPSDVKVQNIRVSDIEPENNDRTEFKGIEELGESIKEHGLAQPITVRPRPAHMGEGPPYVIVAGERRWRAHQHIGAEEIPAIVRDLTDEEASGVMLVENLARVDINPMDEAMAYADRMEKFGYTVEEVAKIAGVKPHRVKTYLPLLKLAPELQDLVKKGSLAMGIGYELVGQNGVVLDSDRQMAAFKAFQSEGLSMAQVRHVVARLVDAQSQDSMFDSNDFMQVEEWTREAKAKKVSKKTLMKTFSQVVEELAKHDPKNPLVTQARMMLNPDDEAVAASAAVVDETMLADGVDIDDDWYDRLRMLRRLTVALAGYGPNPAVDAATGILNPGQDPATTFATMKARLYAQFANPNHDERGRFARKDEGRRVPTKGIDGHSGIPDKVSLSGTLTPDQISQILGQPGPGIPVDSAAEAIEHLLNGRKVELPTRREVAVLLDELRDLVTEAKTAGEKAPEFNLCGVTIKGSSLFCEHNQGIPRIEMPQLSGRPLPGSPADALPRDDQGNVNLADKFRDHLAAKGVKIADDAIPASMLKATQNELQGTKVANIAVKVEAGRMPPARLFVSNDNYIVDGHHRWAATIGADYRDNRDDLMPVDVAVVDMGILELLVEANHFADDWGIPQASMIGSSAQGPPPKPDGPHRATQFANPYHDVDDGRFTRAGEGRVVPTRGLGPHSNVEWGPKRLDTPVEDYGMTYDHAAASSPDVVWAKTWDGWDDQPVVDLPLGGELIATEKLLVSQSVAKYGYEPVPDGYEARVMIDDQDRMVIIDGHHRFAHMRVQRAKTIPVRILTRAVRAAAHQAPRLAAAAMKADLYAQFANPYHDERGRFAPKNTGRRVPTAGVDGHAHQIEVVGGATVDELWTNIIGTPEHDSMRDEASDPRFAPNKGFGHHLKPGEIMTKVRDSPTGQILYDVGAVHGVPIDKIGEYGEYVGMNGSGGLLYKVPGSERPVTKVFRIMDVAEWRQAKQRGFFQSDGRMNLGDEGTVVSTRSTGTFYAPPVGRSAVIVRMRVDPADGWTMDMNPDGRTAIDGYMKTHAPIPFDRVEAVTVPFEVYEEEFGDYGNTMQKYRVLDDDPLVASAGEFANPNHDELGRFARKGEGRAVPTKGIPDKTSIATAATKIGSAVERLHAWKPGYPFDTDGIPGPLKSGALDWIHYRRLLPIRAAAASITGIESTDPSPAQPTQPSQRQRDQAAALLEAIAASPPKTVQRGLHLSASDADAMLEAGGIADAMATSTTVDWIAENFALGLYRTSRAGGPTVGVLVTYRNTRALPITPIYVGEGKGGVSHLLASADEHLISGRFRFDPASVRTETLQGARVIHVDAYPEEEAAAVAASGGVTIDGFFVPPYGCDGGSITGALASADASTEFTAAHQFRNPYKDELGRFTTPEGDADGVEDIEIDHDPDFPVKEGFKRVFTHSARLRAAKERGVSIPPGWRNTQVSKDPDAPGLRARGVDAAGRVQPRYSRDHIESASAEKYQRILSFQTRYAERLDDHLREDAETDPTAGAVVLMRRMGLRPGSTADTRAKVQAYGATTLEARHVKFLDDGKTVKLDFTGKKGVRIQLSTKDKLVYRTLLAHTAGKKPGERIFQTTSDRTNAYLARVLHDAPTFTNRDLRTILGTGYARRMTRRMPIPRTAAENRRARKKVAERVARILGNEPGEALRSYIAPEVFDAAGW